MQILTRKPCKCIVGQRTCPDCEGRGFVERWVEAAALIDSILNQRCADVEGHPFKVYDDVYIQEALGFINSICFKCGGSELSGQRKCKCRKK
jgi:RNA polymerase subunit RPABC4/transcription elongation factor Spt4